jgi:hypothetical protein
MSQKQLLIRLDELGFGYGLWVDGKKVQFYRAHDDLVALLQQLGQLLDFDVSLGPQQSPAEYEQDWC